MRCRSGVIGPGFDSLGRVLMTSKLVPCSRAIISDYVAWLCAGVSTDGVPCHYEPDLDGNDPLLLLRLYSFIFCMVSVLHSGMSALIWGGVPICSPRYLLVVYVWDIVGHILFLGVYI